MLYFYQSNILYLLIKIWNFFFYNLEFWLNSVNIDLLNLHKEILTTDDWFEKEQNEVVTCFSA